MPTQYSRRFGSYWTGIARFRILLYPRLGLFTIATFDIIACICLAFLIYYFVNRGKRNTASGPPAAAPVPTHIHNYGKEVNHNTIHNYFYPGTHPRAREVLAIENPAGHDQPVGPRGQEDKPL